MVTTGVLPTSCIATVQYFYFFEKHLGNGQKEGRERDGRTINSSLG